jgi:hypothetical protein
VRSFILTHPLPLVILLALILSLQLIPHSHFFGDDYIQIGTLEGTVADFGSAPFFLYSFADGRPDRLERQTTAGPLPWFAHPRFKVNFFRPINSLLLTLDHALFGRWVYGYRIQAIFWYLGLIAALAAWLRRVIPAVPRPGPGGETGTTWPGAGIRWPAAAVLALFIFAVSDSHWVNVLWTAGRWVLPAVTLSLLGCVAHLRWRQEGWRPGRILSMLAFAAGLLAGEVALAVMAYPIVLEICRPGGRRPGRLAAVVPIAGVAVAYLVFYNLAGFGAFGNDIYLNPLSDPVRFLLLAPTRILAMCSEIFLWFPAGLWNVDALRPTVVAAGGAGLGLAAILLVPVFLVAPETTRWRLAGLVLGTAGSMLPLAAGDPGGRNLIVPFIGTSALLGYGVNTWWTVIRRKGSVAGVVAVLMCCGIGFIHLGLAPFGWLTGPAGLERDAASLNSLVRESELIAPDTADTWTVFLTPHFGVSWRGYFIRRFEALPVPDRWWMLSAADADHDFRRTGNNRLELRIVDGQMMATNLESAIRSADTPIAAGETFRLQGLEVRVLEAGDRGPIRVMFTFDKSLDDPSLVLLGMLEGRLQRVAPPPIGETLHLPSPF